MELFSADGVLSDEIILNILLHIPTATDFLSFAATCSRLSDLCLYEEDRYNYWRYFYARRFHLDPYELMLYTGENEWRKLYKERIQVQQMILGRAPAPASLGLASPDELDLLKPKLRLCIEAKDATQALAALQPLHTVHLVPNASYRTFHKTGGHNILVSMIGQFSDSRVALLAMKFLFTVATKKEDIGKDNRPIGVVRPLIQQTQCKEPDNRRLALGLLWAYGGGEYLGYAVDDNYAVHFPKLGAVEPLVKFLDTDEPRVIMCVLPVLSKCVTQEGVPQLKALDILRRLVDLLDSDELNIKSGAMKLLTYDTQRVGELGAIPKLLKITTDAYDKVESLAMMALIVLECLAGEEHNRSLMGKDDTLPTMITLLNCDKSELQKQAVFIVKSLTKLEVNARRFRQLGGLDALLNLLYKADLPDVLSCICRSLLDITADIREFAFGDNNDVFKRLASTYSRLSDLLVTHHDIVKEASAGCLAKFLSVIPPASQATEITERLLATLLKSDAADQTATNCMEALAMLAFYDRRVFVKPEAEESELSVLAQKVLGLFLKSRSPVALELLAILFRSQFAAASVSSTEFSDILQSLVADVSSPSSFFACIVLAFQITHNNAAATPQALQSIENFVALVKFNVEWTLDLPSLEPFAPLFESSHLPLQILASWLLAHMSSSQQGRKRIKQTLALDKIAALKAQVQQSSVIQQNLGIYDKNMIASSVFL